MTLRAAVLEMLFTANTDDVARAEKVVKQTAERVEKNPVKVGADVKGALGGMDRVEQAAKKLVSKDVVATVDANIERGQKSLDRVQKRLDYLRSVSTDLDVKADISRAEASLSKVKRNLDGLTSARATMEVDADTSSAEDALDNVKGKAGEAGEDSGDEFGKSIIAALVSIPIAGAVIGIGAAAGKAIIDGFNEGLQVEVGYDRLQALTGVSEVDALRLGRAAGESYANNFGESIESNMDATRLSLQFRILDPAATTRDAQLVVQGLTGIADVLGEDVQPVAASVATLLSTGVAKSSKEAFDLIATGARNGVNRADDLLDTLTEYPALFQRLGLSGPEALGLISQGLDAGARNSDLAADALKEFQIRATDASVLSAQSFESLGLNAEEMTAKIASGGQEARDGLAEVLAKLRETEDPVLRNAAAVGLFGTQAEDLGAALFAMDLSTAVDQLDGVAGSAQRMFDTLASNDASKIEQAQRNIEVAAEGIKGALASVFAEPLGDFADWVSQNRGPVLEFFRDMAIGALDFAITASDSVGEFVSGPMADMVDSVIAFLKLANFDPFKDWSDIDAFAAGMRDFDVNTDSATDKLKQWKGELTEFTDPLIALGYVNDAALRTADAVAQVGFKADGTAASTSEMKTQTEAAVVALQAELDAAVAAGESQQNLTDRYNASTEALVQQLIQMGYTDEEARALIETYGAVPELVQTTIEAHTEAAQAEVNSFIESNAQRNIRIKVYADGSGFTLPSSTGGREVTAQYHGGIVEMMANGGIRGGELMQPLAQMVPPNTYRVVGDRSDVPELFAPLDGSARSWNILMEGISRMPGAMPMADGSVLTPTVDRRSGTVSFGDIVVRGEGLTVPEVLSLIKEEIRNALDSALGG